MRKQFRENTKCIQTLRKNMTCELHTVWLHTQNFKAHIRNLAHRRLWLRSQPPLESLESVHRKTWMVKLATMESQNEGGIGGILTQIIGMSERIHHISSHNQIEERHMEENCQRRKTMNKNASNHETVWKISKAKAFKRYEQILQLWNESFFAIRTGLPRWVLSPPPTHWEVPSLILAQLSRSWHIPQTSKGYAMTVPSMTFHDRSWLRWLTPDISPLQLSRVPHVDLTFSWLNPGVLQGLIKSLSFTTSFCL